MFTQDNVQQLSELKNSIEMIWEYSTEVIFTLL